MRDNTGAGTSLKPADRWCVSLCAAHHMEQHRIGHKKFDALYGVSLRALAETLAARSPFL